MAFGSVCVVRRGSRENKLGEGTRKSKNWSWTEEMSCPVDPDGSLASMREASSSSNERGRVEVKDR